MVKRSWGLMMAAAASVVVSTAPHAFADPARYQRGFTSDCMPRGTFCSATAGERIPTDRRLNVLTLSCGVVTASTSTAAVIELSAFSGASELPAIRTVMDKLPTVGSRTSFVALMTAAYQIRPRYTPKVFVSSDGVVQEVTCTLVGDLVPAT